MRIENRHVIYVQGYDPRGLAQYYRMFRTELRKFAQLYSIAATIGRPDTGDGREKASWTIDTQGQGGADGWRVHTHYDFLRTEDLIKRDLDAPIWQTLFRASRLWWGMLLVGTLRRFWTAHWRFAIFMTYPYIVSSIQALVSAGIAAALYVALVALGLPALLGAAIAVVLSVAIFGVLLKVTERWTYALYLMVDIIFTYEFAHRQRPDWDARIDRFAEHLVNIAQSSPADEIVLVGHSSGSFLGVEILARALARDPDLGKRGPRIVLLTLGGNLPIVGFHNAARDFRAHLRMLAIEPSIDWIDCQSRKDVMNFYPFDPITGHGIDAGEGRRNPTIVPVRFRDIVSPERYHVFRRQFFRVHFQFVMANDRPHLYDFFAMVCGPVPLRERMTQPAAALDAIAGTPEQREMAWKQLDLGPESANLEKMPPRLGRMAGGSG